VEIRIKVKKRQLISLLVGIGLVVALLLSSCAQQAAPTTPTTPAAPTTPTTPTTPAAPQVVTKEVEKVYKVLNPQGTYAPVECKPCAPRLDTMNGKTILYYQSEAAPQVMPVLYKWLLRDYPKTTFDKIEMETYGESVPTDAQIKKYDAQIRGISW
jgi:hypothetical protein